MAEEDIYGNKRRYERRIANLDELSVPPFGTGGLGSRKYYCRNPRNLLYFRKLHQHFEASDLSYIHRNRLFHILLFVTSLTDKVLSDCDRDDIDLIIAGGHQVNRAVDSKKDFLRGLKRIWRVLLPDCDERGRVDDAVVPYVVRHVSCRVDKSRERRRKDRLSPEELNKLVGYFASDPRMQAYITLAVESLGRPQELCYTRIADVELSEGYARVWVSAHGKEGTKFLHCIDSYAYLMKWYERHPYQSDPDAFLFLARGERNRSLTPSNITKKLHDACRKLGIEKSITAYSLKRNGVTLCRLRGDSDVEIQHRAGWTSTKQLQTYDMSTPEDAFRQHLARRGLVEQKNGPSAHQESRTCVCGALIGYADKVCHRRKRLADPSQITEEARVEQEIRRVIAVAVRNPNLTLAEIMEQCRLRRQSRSHRA